ncbi:MAG: ATP synthase F0 subunit B [Spirochaetales bacterium]|jgi:F-type H+-transporting ATPase subunit b|nr:ATP synthase F0 subunit B [Spirochaetales bacterium]
MLDFSVTFVFTLINIFVLFVILRLILFKPVTKLMQTRARAIAADIEEAKSEKAQAKSLLQNYEERLKNAGAEVESIIREAREEARRQADAIVAGGRTEARNILENARKQVSAEHRAALAAFQAEAAALVVTAAGRLLRQEITREDSFRHAQMILREIKD